MKKILIFMSLVMMTVLPCLSAQADEVSTPEFSHQQQMLFDAVRYCNDLPKNSQVLTAMEYYCKVEGQQLRLMLMTCTQSPDIEALYGNAAALVILDADTGHIYSYSNITPYEGTPIATKADAINAIFSHFDSHVSFSTEQIYADHEMIFPLTTIEIESVNTALTQHFAKPAASNE